MPSLPSDFVNKYNVLSWLLLGLDVLLLVYLFAGQKIANALCRKRKVRLGKSAYIVPIVVVLYLTLVLQLVYESDLLKKSLTFFSFINVINELFAMFAASVNPGKLVSANPAYYVALLFGTLLAVGSTVFSAVKISLYFFGNRYRVKRRIKHGNCNVFLNFETENDIGFGKKSVVWFTQSLNEEAIKQLKRQKTCFLIAPFDKTNIESFFGKTAEKNYTFVVQSTSNGYLSMVDEFDAFLRNNAKACQNRHFLMYLLLNYENYFSVRDNLLTDDVKSLHIVCGNMQEMLALSFVEKYPITCDLKDKFLDFSTATVTDDCDINVVYLGFGKMSYSLFFNSVMNDQLVCVKNTEDGFVLSPKRVNYFAFDKATVFLDGSNYYSSFGKYDGGVKYFDQADYFPFPQKPCNFTYRGNMDVNDSVFFQEVLSVVLKNRQSFTRIVVALGNDEENIDETTKLLLILRQNGWENFHIYVRLKNHPNIVDTLFGANQKYVTFFGETLTAAQVYEETQKLLREAQRAYDVYASAKISVGESVSETIAWNRVYNYRSSKHAALNLRLKVNLLGYDFSQEEGIGSMELKNADTLPSPLKEVFSFNVNDNYETRTFRPVADKSQISPAKSLAYQEKLRWNAFMMSQRFSPMTVCELESTAGQQTKNFETRTHACLTSVEGLHCYHQKMAALTGKSLEEVDTYRYDYGYREALAGLMEERNLCLVPVCKKK